jgi:hypothetical protein
MHLGHIDQLKRFRPAKFQYSNCAHFLPFPVWFSYWCPDPG